MEKNKNLRERLSKLKTYYTDKNIETHQMQAKGIVGKSPQIQHVLAQAGQVARVDTTVSIFGETGVGKELVARVIHLNSSRHYLPFIPVNCSALSDNLIYSELFGHEKGAFTGAERLHIGRF